MIRDSFKQGWRLITHEAHAHLAGKFARHWKNDQFEPPMPFTHVLDAIRRHDDSWITRDSHPEITKDGLPSAFSSSLVGQYEAFEEISLEPYLEVRKQATKQARKRDPYAAVLISMHTVNLLTEQADLSTLNEEQRSLHSEFINDQRSIQTAIKKDIRDNTIFNGYASDQDFQRAFEFLQACDSLSLFVCVDYDESTPLRHEHPRNVGDPVQIVYERVGSETYSCEPWPFDERELSLTIPYRYISQRAFDDAESFRQEYHDAAVRKRNITLLAD